MPDSFKVDTRDLTRLSRELQRTAPQAHAALKVAFRAAGGIVANDARNRSSKYSKRIPGSIRLIVRSNTVLIRAGGAAAPNAAPIENHGKGHVRHPIPRTDKWTDKNSPPAFLGPSVDAHQALINGAIEAVYKAVDEGVRGR